MTDIKDEYSFLNNFWTADRTGMDHLLNYMYSTHDELNHLHTVYTKRAQLEYEYSQTLLNLSHLFLNNNKRNHVYHTLHLELEQTSKSHLDLSNQLRNDVSFRLGNKLLEYDLLLKKWQMTLEELFTEREQLTLKLLKIQAKYLKEHDLSNGKSTPSYETLKKQYKYSVAEVNNISEEWNIVWKDACRTLEAMEEDRVEFIKINMWDYANRISENLLVQDNWCENIRLALEKYTVDEEIKSCVKNHGTGSQIPSTKDYVDDVYQSQKAKKNRKEKLENLRQSLRLKKQQSLTASKNNENNNMIIETLGRSKSLGDLTQMNEMHQNRQPPILKTKHSSMTQNLSRSDSSNLPRQPYEYKPDTGSFPNRKSSIDSSFVTSDDTAIDTSSSPVYPPPMMAPRSPRPSPRPSPYSTPNVSSHHVFGQSYPPSSYFQHQMQPLQQQPIFNQNNRNSPLIMPQPIPLPQYRYKSAPCSPVEQGFTFPIQPSSTFLPSNSFAGVPLPPLPPNFSNINR